MIILRILPLTKETPSLPHTLNLPKVVSSLPDDLKHLHHLLDYMTKKVLVL